LAVNRRLPFLFLIVLVATLRATLTPAQDRASVDDVVALVLEIPEIANGLAGLSGYRTLAYNSHNAYGIWQVEFQNLEGETVAWAQVQPSTGKVFAWDVWFAADDALYDSILPVFQSFVANHPDVRSLVRGIHADDIYPWWDGDASAWVAWIGDAGDAIMVAVQFDGGDQNSHENPVLTDLWFPNLPSYDEWWVAASSEAVAIAFSHAEVAVALRGESWTTDVSLVDGNDTNVWTVHFLTEGEIAARATVDVIAGELIEYSIGDE
jgi:hypothetical protein